MYLLRSSKERRFVSPIMSQMLNFQHSTHKTPKFSLYEMCQMLLKKKQHGVAVMFYYWHCTDRTTKIIQHYFIEIFSLLNTFLSLSLSLSNHCRSHHTKPLTSPRCLPCHVAILPASFELTTFRSLSISQLLVYILLLGLFDFRMGFEICECGELWGSV